MKSIGIWVLLSCMGFSSQASGQSGLITTVAGSGAGFFNGGFSGDGGPATSASFNWPSGVAVDASGNLFIADFDNNRIRKVSASGIITTVAGSGATGHTNGTFSGDGGPATSATMAGPVAVAVDAARNIYIADTYNSRIRKVSAANGIITTVAGNGTPDFSGDGGLATSAALNFPEGVAVDVAGNIYIADTLNNRIRKVSPGGTITTVAGNGTAAFAGDGGPAAQASFSGPKDVAVDAAGNLFIADVGNNRVRKVSAGGIVTTVAGNGASGFCGSPACASDGGPATSAALSVLQGVAVDNAGNLFIAVANDERIRKVSDGIITTVAGDGEAGFAGDDGPATAAFLNYPEGAAVDASGNLFIADYGNERIREVLAQTPVLTTLPAVINVSIVAGGSSSQQVGVSSDLPGLAWTASTSSNWITPSPASGNVPDTFSAIVDTTSLQPGAYTGTITIRSAQASPPETTVNVNLTVIAAGASLSAAPASLKFLAAQSGPAQSQSLQIGGTSGVMWQASSATSTGGTWLSVSPPSGNVPSLLTALVNPAGLAPGTYQGSITIQAPGATPPSVMVGVTLTVTPPSVQFVQESELVGSGAVNNPIGAFEGYSVALSGDGNTALIGGWEDNNFSGAAWVFTRSGGVWTQQGDKLGDGNGFDMSRRGWSVALSADGNTAAVGGPGVGFGDAGGVWIYTRNAGVWTQQGGVLTGSGAVPESGDLPLLAFQGTAVSLSADGNTLLEGGPNDNNSAGAAWVFTRSGGVWSQLGGKLVGTGAAGAASQGSSVALSGDGNTAILGGPGDNSPSGTGAAWVFTLSGGVWSQQGGKLVGTGAVGDSGQGNSVALSSDGNTAIVGGPGDEPGGAGAAWVFTRSGNAWSQQGGKLVGSGAIGFASQGSSVALSSDGNTAVVGGPSDESMTNPIGNTSEAVGAAWVFTRSTGSWTQAGPALVGSGAAGAASEGTSVALSGDGQTAILGGPLDGGEFGSGAAWVFAASSSASEAPSISGLTPSSATAGGSAFTLTANGSGFVAGSTVQWNGSSLPTNFVGARQVTASVPAGLIATAGTVQIVVANPSGLSSNAATFTIAPPVLPVITSVSPFSAAAGSASVTVKITGTGFASGTVAQWNGLSLSTSYVSSTSLTAQLPASDLTTPGTRQITVVNANGSVSNAFTFTVTSSSLQLVTVAPCRVMDTRLAKGPLGGPSLAAGTTRAIPIPSGSCGVPANAMAYALNFTVVPGTDKLGSLTVWPTGESQPLVQTLTSPDGSVLASAAIVPAGTAGSINAYVTDETDLIVDINGYFVPPAASTLQFYPLPPCRVLDTRQASGTFGGPTIAGGTSRSFPIASSSCGAPASAAAYSLNVTVVPPGYLGYLTTWPTGQAQPYVSTMNAWGGTVIANAAIVPAGTGGAVSFFASEATDVVVDINGYFAPPGANGLNFYTVVPCRLVDTRKTNGTFGGPTMSGYTTRNFPLSEGSCGLPGTPALQAYSLSVSVVPQGVLPYLTIWPAGVTQPVVSTLNAWEGQAVSNAALVPAGTGGSVSVFVTNTTDVIIDTAGFFGP